MRLRPLLLMFRKSFPGHAGRPGHRGGSVPLHFPNRGYHGDAEGPKPKAGAPKSERVMGIAKKLREVIKRQGLSHAEADRWFYDALKRNGFSEEEITVLLEWRKTLPPTR